MLIISTSFGHETFSSSIVEKHNYAIWVSRLFSFANKHAFHRWNEWTELFSDKYDVVLLHQMEQGMSNRGKTASGPMLAWQMTIKRNNKS